MERYAAFAGALAVTSLLAACGGGGGGVAGPGATNSGGGGQGAESGVTVQPETSPTPAVPVTILGKTLSVIHLEMTDFLTAYNMRGGVTARFLTNGGHVDLTGSGSYRGNYTCPGRPPAGNECDQTGYTFDGEYHAASHGNTRDSGPPAVGQSFLPHPTGHFHVGGRGHTEVLDRTRRDRAGHRNGEFQGFSMYVTDEFAPTVRAGNYQNEIYGGLGDWMTFYVAGAGPSTYNAYRQNQAAISNYAVAMGQLYRNPNGESRPDRSIGGAHWRGAMVGREAARRGAGRVHGKSAVEYDFSDDTVDVRLTEIVYADSGGPAHEPQVSFDDLPVLGDASFFIPGHGNHLDRQNPSRARGYIDGDFYGERAQEVGGVFETDKGMVGAFGAKRE